MPAPRKPNNLKVITGTDQPCRVTDIGANLPSIDQIPNPPTWLPNAHAKKEWKRLAPFLVNNQLLTEAGLSAFGHICALHGKIVGLWSAGETPTAHLISQYRALINDFGLTPVAQGKVKGGSDKGKKNPFSKHTGKNH